MGTIFVLGSQQLANYTITDQQMITFIILCLLLLLLLLYILSYFKLLATFPPEVHNACSCSPCQVRRPANQCQR